MNEDTAPVSLTGLLDRLVEVPAPPPISMLPQTVGWLVVAGLLLAVTAWLVWRRLQHYRANAYRRAALAELVQAGDDPARIAAVVRRTALAAWPRAEVAGLAGDEWLAFLDSRLPGSAFRQEPGRRIAAAPYDGREAPGLNAIARRFVLEHRVGADPGKPAP